MSATSARTIIVKSGVVKNNGFNPVWEQGLSLPFDCVGDMLDLIFVRIAVKQEDKDDDEPLAVYCSSLGSLNLGELVFPPSFFASFHSNSCGSHVTDEWDLIFCFRLSPSAAS